MSEDDKNYFMILGYFILIIILIKLFISGELNIGSPF